MRNQTGANVVDLHKLYKEENAYAMSPPQQKLFIAMIREKMRQENGEYDHMHGKLYLANEYDAQAVEATAREMLRFIKKTF